VSRRNEGEGRGPTTKTKHDCSVFSTRVADSHVTTLDLCASYCIRGGGPVTDDDHTCPDSPWAECECGRISTPRHVHVSFCD
jgi:hypothetical protein